MPSLPVSPLPPSSSLAQAARARLLASSKAAVFVIRARRKTISSLGGRARVFSGASRVGAGNLPPSGRPWTGAAHDQGTLTAFSARSAQRRRTETRSLPRGARWTAATARDGAVGAPGPTLHLRPHGATAAGRDGCSRSPSSTGALVLPGAAAAAADESRPTADPSAPTPTAPYAGLPPQGTAPDGSTVGGEDLDTREVVVADDAPDLPPGLAASGWLVADAGTGEVLAARDPHGRYYPASTLKTLTLLTLAPLLDPDLVVEGTAEDESVEGSRVGLVQGGRYPVALLFQALILQSGNDAANALARAAGGLDGDRRGHERDGRADRRLRHRGGHAVRSGRRRAVLLALRPRPDLPRAARRPGDGGRPGHPDRPDARGRGPLPRLPDPEPEPAAHGLRGQPRRQDRLHRRRAAHVRHRGRAQRAPARRQRHGHRGAPLRAADQAALLLDWGVRPPGRRRGRRDAGRVRRPRSGAVDEHAGGAAEPDAVDRRRRARRRAAVPAGAGGPRRRAPS